MAFELMPRELLHQVANRFKLLGEPVRLEILNHLHVQGEMNVQELMDATGQQQANVSKHLRLLAGEGVVTRRKDGLFSYYAIADPSLSGLCLLVCGQIQNAKPTH